MLSLEPAVSRETHLEAGVHNYLGTEFFIDPAVPFRGNDYIIVNTARGGGSGGKWTRPDLTLIAIQELYHHRRVDLELFGFEIKKDGVADLSSVFEAVAHTRFVHYAYLICQVIAGATPSKVANEIEKNCLEHGIGLIVFRDAYLSSSYSTILAPQRHSPHPFDVEEYIAQRLPEARDDLLSRTKLAMERIR
jgi:hypothetical protein